MRARWANVRTARSNTKDMVCSGPYLAEAHTKDVGIRWQAERGLGWDGTETNLRNRFRLEEQDWSRRE